MRKLALLTTTAVAALAMTASSAMAATTVINPDNGQACPAVSPAINASNAGVMSTTRSYTSGGCTIRMSSSLAPVIYYGAQVGQQTTCHVNFDAHIGPDGWGYANNFSYLGCSPVSAQSCTGARLIAPRSYTGPAGLPPLFSYTDAGTDLNVELCSKTATTPNVWGHVSMDIANNGTSWTWTNQYDGADALSGSPFQKHRGGIWTTVPADYLTISHS